MKKVFLSAILLVFIQTCYSVDAVKSSQILKKTKSGGKHFKTEIPFTYLNKLIVFEANINDSKTPYRFILDTGAPTFISNEIVLNHNLISSTTEVAYDVSNNLQTVSTYYLDRLTIGNNVFKNIGVLSFENIREATPMKGRADGGLIGADVMKNHIWMIDYKNKKIILTDNLDSLILGDNYVISKMKFNSTGAPVITVILSNEKTIDMTVDAGFNGSVILPKNIFKQNLFAELNESKDQQLTTGFVSEKKKLKYRFLKQLQIGNLKQKNVKTTSIENNTTALLGNEFLENYNVVFDFINKLFILIPNDGQAKNIILES